MLNYCKHGNYSDAVVYVETDAGSGTAFSVTDDGYAITCAHVVRDAQEIYVKVTDGKDVSVKKAENVVVSEKADIALIKIDGKDFKHVEVDYKLKDVPLGRDVAILGFPLGSRIADNVMELGISLCKGYVSSRQTKDGIDYIMLDVDVKAGYSGSPVIDCKTGRVIGILCGQFTNGGNGGDGVDFMLPLTYITEIVE